MNGLRFADKLMTLRRERKITQEQLADFLGVTKASVSKWENKQSLPDILLLPQLAAFFNVTVDELLGYEPQLSQEQIRKIYQELTEDFAEKPFSEVMEKSRGYVHRYYSCFPFLIQVGVLWLNHFFMADTQEEQRNILKEMEDLCEHVRKDCQNADLRRDAMMLKASADLQLGKIQEVIETLEDYIQGRYLTMSGEGILVQAYQMAGELEKARSSTQMYMYLRMLDLMQSNILYLLVNAENLSVCEETIHRADCLIEAYQMKQLNPNAVAQLEYQAAVTYMMHGKCEQAMERLSQYTAIVLDMLKQKNFYLHGDAYFDKLDEWIQKLQLGDMPPRNRKLVVETAVQSLNHPLFTALEAREDFRQLKMQMERLQAGANL